jgi:hypothetical protein
MTTVEAKCPKCGFRVWVTAKDETPIDPASRCHDLHVGWARCPNLKPALTAARQRAGNSIT